MAGKTIASGTSNYVAAPTNPVDTGDFTQGQDHERVMKSTGPARESLESAYIEVVDRPVDAEKLAMLKFMEDELDIMVNPSSNPTDEQVVEVFVNGEREFFKRGESKRTKRKFVNILASQKTTTYTQERRRDAYGVMFDVQIPHTALRYQFSVLHDPHPRGRDWLIATLAQA